MKGEFIESRSNWNKGNSYIARDGDLNENGGYDAGETLELHSLNKHSLGWSSLKWRLERLAGTTNVYRIQNVWEQGYLTRTGEQDSAGNWFPTADVTVEDLHMNWWSQRWIIDYKEDDAFRIRSIWSNGNDYLTRRGESDGNGGYTATNEIQLQEYN